MQRIKKGLRVIKNSGIKDGSRIIWNKIRNNPSQVSQSVTINSSKRDIFKFYEYIYFNANKPGFTPNNLDEIKVLWFIPDFGIGSGGHLNIFRMILNLSKLGVKSDIAICGDSQWLNSKIAGETIKKHFFELNSEITIIKDQADIDRLDGYHVAMATSWDTAYFVNYFKNCYRKAYFVQDYEPFFYPVGSRYVFAENTYKFGFYGITAGSWLSSKLKKDFQMECNYFSFSYERELYSKHERIEKTRRVFFYARPPTDRRAFELGLLVLKKLCDINPDIEVVLAGWDTSDYHIPFNHVNPGIVALEDLSKLYSQCDVALVLSFTNLSLLPLELLASGCPVVTNYGENNSWIDEQNNLFIYAETTVEDILEKVSDTLSQKVSIDFDVVDRLLSESSWENESRKVKGIIEGIVHKK